MKYWSVNSQYSHENNFDHYLHTMYAHAWYIQSRYIYIRTQGRAGKPTAEAA